MHLILTRPGRRRPVATRRLRDAMLSPAHHACTSTSARIALCLPAVASTPHTTQAGSTPRGAHPLSGDLSARLPSSDGCTEYGLLRPLIDLLRGSVCGLFGLDQQGLEIVLLRRLRQVGYNGNVSNAGHPGARACGLIGRWCWSRVEGFSRGEAEYRGRAPAGGWRNRGWRGEIKCDSSG